jgi:hypothetical protein
LSCRAALLAAIVAATLVGPAGAGEAISYVPVKNEAFKAGEKLTFSLKYEFVTAGTATMEVQEGPVISNRPTLSIISSARSNSFIDKMFKVRDFNGSTVDRDTLACVHFHQNLKEGKYQVIRNTSIDYPNRTYRYERIYKGKTETQSGEVKQMATDILSSFFVARAMALEPGKDYSIDVFSDQKIYPLRVHVQPKLETIKVAAGKFECLRLEPAIQGDSIFKASDGKMSLWVTNDARHMPVLIRSKVAVGAFDAELAEYNN